MDVDEQYLSLIKDFSRIMEVELSPDDEGSVCFQFDDGIVVHFCDSGNDVFAVIVSTGVEIEKISANIIPELFDLFLQINFATLLSSHISIALSPENTIAVTYSDYASRLDGKQLFSITESMIDKARTLKTIILAIDNKGDVDDHNDDDNEGEKDTPMFIDKFI